MKLSDVIRFSRQQAGCRNCAHFNADPAMIEQAYPGLTALSSGYASVRDEDGLCNYHQIYLSANDSCADILLVKALAQLP
jgi:hypothetical protein